MYNYGEISTPLRKKRRIRPSLPYLRKLLRRKKKARGGKEGKPSTRREEGKRKMRNPERENSSEPWLSH